MIATHRLHAQQLVRPRFATPAEVVAWMGAVQAQDYLASLWAVGMRMPAASAAAIEAAIADGSIVRMHAMRFTWQLIARDDVRWILGLVGPRLLASAASRFATLGLSPAALARSSAVLARAVEGGQHRTRGELAAALARARIKADGLRFIFILGHAELSGVLTSGARRGKQATFAALDERVPPAPARDRDAAIAELARRFVQSRAPATLADFVWWSGLPGRDTRAAFDRAVAASEPARPSPGGAGGAGVHLIPAFDEYLVGYADRSAVLAPAHKPRYNAGGGMLNPCIVVDGTVVGTWRRTLERAAVVVELEPFARLSRVVRAAIDGAAARYGAFLGLPARVVVSTRWSAARNRPAARRPRPRRA